MAVTFDAISGYNTVSNSNPLTYSFTVGSGTNRALFVCFASGNNGTTPSTVTYAGVSMTLVNHVAYPSNEDIWVYSLSNPTSGANNVVITMTGSDFTRSFAISYAGVDQTTPAEASTAVTGTAATDFTGSVTTLTDSAWIAMFHSSDVGNITYSAGTNTTIRLNTNANGNDYTDSNAANSPAGNYSQVITSSTSSTHAGITFSIKPAGTVASSVNLRTLLGVGI